MNKLFKNIVCIVMCAILVFSCSAFASAASVGKVDNVSVNSVAANRISFSWNDVPEANSYRVYKYFSSLDRYVLVGSTRSTAYTDWLFLTPGKTYSYKIRACDTIGFNRYGKQSEAIYVTTPPITVTGLQVSNVETSSAKLSWDEARGAAGYRIYFSDSSEQDFAFVASTTSTSYTFDQLIPGKEYKCRVAAYHEIEDLSVGGYSSVVSFTTLAPITDIDAPANLKATTDHETVKLSWTESENADGYEVYRYNNVTNEWQMLTSTGSAAYVDDAVSGTDIFKYKVRAVDEINGEKIYSEYSNVASVLFETIIENESIYNEDFSQSGLFGYLYDPAEKCFYTSSDPWQRNAGYNSLYDTFAPTTLITFDTVRLRFDYGEKNWMIQVWKGQYGAAFYGAEIGVYTKPTSRKLMHYDCASDDELLKMSLDFYEYENRLIGKDGWEKKFTRPYDSYWWCTGFIPGNKLGNYDILRIDARITMRDYEMLSAFKGALEENSIPYTVSGLNVYFSY